ncbi:hypothetical protein KAU92_06440, partial [Candidatus Bathyarchaeota archaeon]|nr:hypothetical protein [Candidatus Bathyarchaeota archaeon]
MKYANLILLVFLIASLVATTWVQIPPVKAQEPLFYYVNLDLKRPYGFRGEQINLTALTNYDSVVVEIYLPNLNLWKNETYLANETRLTNIAGQAPFGEYRIIGKIPNSSHTIWFSVVDGENFQATSFPFLKVHKDIEYYVFGNKTLAMVYGEQRLSVHLPDLPSGVSINCYNNSDIFVARFKDDFLGINIDLSLVFVHEGAKLVLNGTSDVDSFSFKFYSPRQIKKFFDKIKV